MKKYTLPKKTILLWQIRIFILGFSVVAVLLYLNIYLYICVTVMVFFGAVIFLILPYFLRSWSITVTNGKLIVKFGILIETTHIFPYTRLIYTKSCISPLARAFGLSAFEIKAVSGNLYIPEIDNVSLNELITAFQGRNRVEK